MSSSFRPPVVKKPTTGATETTPISRCVRARVADPTLEGIDRLTSIAHLSVQDDVRRGRGDDDGFRRVRRERER